MSAKLLYELPNGQYNSILIPPTPNQENGFQTSQNYVHKNVNFFSCSTMQIEEESIKLMFEQFF